MTLAVLGRYWRTLRQLQPEQLCYLLWRRLLRQPRGVARPVAGEPRFAHARGCCLPLTRCCWLGGGRFVFLDRARDFGATVDWRAPGESRLWRYHLHYFDWLRQPDSTGESAFAQMQAWIAANPPFAGAGWEPYPVSLRLVNWAGALARCDAQAVPPAVSDSLALQAAWLARNLEYHLGANHLFVNLKALLFASACFAGSFGERLAATAVPRFARELERQFLADGGHYERSPMYHASLTRDLLELCALSARVPTLLPAGLRERLVQKTVLALEFAQALAPPDDSVFQFNDATAEFAPSCAELADFAGTLGLWSPAPAPASRLLDSRTASGYFVVRERDHVVVFDCGELGPPHQPGHAHCDLLAFELFLDGRRVITNAGNFDYEWSAERAYARSTGAHNTVVVDATEQAEVWGAFRVGRRAHPLSAVLEPGAGGATRFAGAHDAYHHLPGRVTHTREALVGPDFDLRIEDWLTGGGTHSAVSWVHFAVGLTLASTAHGYAVRDAEGSAIADIVAIDAHASELMQTPRYPAFGRALTASSLRLARSGELPFRLAFTVRRMRGVSTLTESSS